MTKVKVILIILAVLLVIGLITSNVHVAKPLTGVFESSIALVSGIFNGIINGASWIVSSVKGIVC